MSVLKIYKLEDKYPTEPVTCLPVGEHVIGRGPLLQCDDKRVSRKHAVISITERTVTLKSVHINPCYYIAAESNNMTILPKNEPVELHNDDKFALLTDSFWFKIKLFTELADGCTSNKRPLMENDENDCKRQKTTNSSDVLSDNKDNVKDLNTSDLSIENDVNTTNSNCEESKYAHNENEDDELLTVNNTECNPEETLEKNNELKEVTSNVTNNEIEVKEEICIPETDENINNQPVLNENTTNQPEIDENTNNQPETDENTNKQPATDENTNKQQKDPDIPDTKNNPNTPSTSNSQRRERCWYSANCFRKNPQHREDFSHPGDNDYDSDPNDSRPSCSYGGACYRRNKLHRRSFKHPNRPAAKPNGVKTRKRKTQKATTADSSEDDYDYEDPFIDDSGDEYELSSDGEDTDWEDSQNVEEDSQETRRLVKEAKRFTKKK